jgi:ATP phosphoribosyltransferase
VCDVVETGTTLRAAGLRIIGEPLLSSEAILVGRAGAEEIPAVAQLRRRLRGVLVARQYVLLDYDCPNEILPQATAVTPGLEGPTVSPLQTPGWSAVRAMVRQDDTNHVMDELWQLGARAILVTSIHACRI